MCQNSFRYPRRTRGAPTLTAEASSYSLPDAFGAFRVLHQIGAGRLGPVFRAYQPERERLVAVKMFRLDLLPEQMYALAGELEQLVERHLAHPQIVAPLAAGVQGTSVYLVQELCAGESLDVVMRQAVGPDLAANRRMIAALAAGLDVAAAQGVHHGALHPRDVLVSDGTVRITGFGVTEALERVGVRVLGRHPYGAPERTTGQRWGTPADVFALAVMAYELLAGRRVSGIADQGIEQLAAAQQADGASLRHVFATALAVEPSIRYQTARGFVAALESTLSATSAPPRQPESVPLPLGGGEGAAAVETGGPAAPARNESERGASRARPPLRAVARRPPPESGEDEDEEERGVGMTQNRGRTAGARNAAGSPDHVDDPDDLTLSDSSRGSDDEAPASARESRPRTVGPPGERDTAAGDLPVVRERGPASLGDFDLDTAAPEAPALQFDVPRDEGREGNGRPARAAAPAPQAPEGARPTPRAPLEPPRRQGAGAPEGLTHARTALWPLVLALGVGLLVGFAGGYGFGLRDGTAATSSRATATSPVRPAPAGVTGVATTPAAAAAAPAAPPASTAPASHAPEVLTPPPAPKQMPPPPNVRRVMIRSEPPGARVTLDGRPLGETPLVVHDVGLGTHHVQFERGGFVSETRRLILSTSAASRTLTVRLRPEQAAAAATGIVTIASRPSGATVVLDGRRVGVTPLVLPHVSAGTHQVRLQMPGYQPWVTSIQVAGGKSNPVTASLEQGSGE